MQLEKNLSEVQKQKPVASVHTIHFNLKVQESRSVSPTVSFTQRLRQLQNKLNLKVDSAETIQISWQQFYTFYTFCFISSASREIFVLFTKKPMTQCKFPPEQIVSMKTCKKVVNIHIGFGGNMETAMRSGWKYVSLKKCVIRRQTVDVFP